MTRTIALILIAAGGLMAQDTLKTAPPAPVISREAALELQLLAAREREVLDKVQAVLALLREPIWQAEQAVIARECARVGIGTGCEVDRKTGEIRRPDSGVIVSPTAAKAVTKDN